MRWAARADKAPGVPRTRAGGAYSLNVPLGVGPQVPWSMQVYSRVSPVWALWSAMLTTVLLT